MPGGKEVRELDIEREKSGVSPSDRSDTGPETGFQQAHGNLRALHAGLSLVEPAIP